MVNGWLNNVMVIGLYEWLQLLSGKIGLAVNQGYARMMMACMDTKSMKRNNILKWYFALIILS